MRITRTLSKQQSPIFLFLVLNWTLLKCLCSVPAAEAYFLVIDAHGEECFFDRVSATTKLGLTFEVVEGGFLDIDVTITGPDQKVIHREERASSGKYTFAADRDGDYTYCFGNKMSSMTPKVLMFSMDTAEEERGHKRTGTKDEDAAAAASSEHRLEAQIGELASGLSAVKHEQEYMAVRERIHRQINESTNWRVLLWASFEALLLVAMTLGQVLFLRRFFEVRRVV